MGRKEKGGIKRNRSGGLLDRPLEIGGYVPLPRILAYRKEGK